MTFFSFNTSSKSFPPQIWIEQLNTKKPRVHEQFYVTASQRVEPRIYNIFRASRLTSRFGREARPGSEVGSTENNIIIALFMCCLVHTDYFLHVTLFICYIKLTRRFFSKVDFHTIIGQVCSST